jgi:hypothetical protein
MILRLTRFLLISVLLRRLFSGFAFRWFWRFIVLAGISGLIAKLVQRYLVKETTDLESIWAETSRAEVSEPVSYAAAAEGGFSTGTTAESTVTERVQPTTEVGFDTFGETVTTPDELAESTDLSAPASFIPVEEQAPEPAAPAIDPQWVRGHGDLDCPEDYPVKAKATSGIFYLPGDAHYDRTIPDVCFAGSEDALASGYRPPKH